MDLSQIRYFLNLAETLNFTEAAKLSGVSQPALTRAVQRLEDELGGVLLYRDGKATRLSALGREIREEFAHIARVEQRIRATVENRLLGKLEVLNIGLTHSLAPSLVSPFVAHALSQMPMLEIVLHPVGQDNAASLVLAGTLDGAFVSDGPRDNPKLEILDLFQERLHLAVGRNHRFIPLELIPATELAEESYFDRLNCEFRTRASEHLMNENVVMRPRLRSEREDWVQQAVADGTGICFLPEFSAIVPGITLRPVAGLDLSRQLSFVSISGSGNQVALRQFRTMLERYDWSNHAPA
jgi:LysR family hydrogen peroxide-inducible transcriptional activator